MLLKHVGFNITQPKVALELDNEVITRVNQVIKLDTWEDEDIKTVLFGALTCWKKVSLTKW